MIFLIITFLAWAILSIGMVGVEWGHGAWAQARLDMTAQFLALDSFSESDNQHHDETIARMIMGAATLPNVHKTVIGPGITAIHVTQAMKWPWPSVLRGHDVHRPFDVSSTATAQLLPARQVGLPQSGDLTLPGALPCALEKEAWETLSEQKPVDMRVNSLGEIFLDGQRIGQFSQIMTHIGQAVPAPQPFQSRHVRFEGYVPIFTKIGTRHRIVGFGFAQIFGTYPHLSIHKQVIKTRSHNASTQVTGKRLRLSQQDLAQVFSINRTLKGAILAPTFM